MNALFPMILLAGGDKTLLNRIMPAMLPGSSERLVFATLAAKKEIKAQAVMEESMVREAVKLARLRDPEQLKESPALNAAFHRLPASVQLTLFPAAAGGDDTKSPGANT